MKNFLVCLEVKSVPRSVQWYKKIGFRVQKRNKTSAIVSRDGAEVELSLPGGKKPKSTGGLTLLLYVQDITKLNERITRHRMKVHSRTFGSPRNKKSELYKQIRYGDKMPPMKTMIKAGLLDAIGLNDPNGHYWLIQSRETK